MKIHRGYNQICFSSHTWFMEQLATAPLKWWALLSLLPMAVISNFRCIGWDSKCLFTEALKHRQQESWPQCITNPADSSKQTCLTLKPSPPLGLAGSPFSPFNPFMPGRPCKREALLKMNTYNERSIASWTPHWPGVELKNHFSKDEVLTGLPGKPISPFCPGRPGGPFKEKETEEWMKKMARASIVYNFFWWL